MPRAKRGFKRRRRVNKVRKLAEGFDFRAGNTFRRMSEAVDRAHRNAYEHRRAKKRDFRQLWISRISAAANASDMSYNRLIEALTKSNVAVNRKMLSEIAIHDPAAFKALVDQVRSASSAA